MANRQLNSGKKNDLTSEINQMFSELSSGNVSNRIWSATKQSLDNYEKNPEIDGEGTVSTLENNLSLKD